MAKQVRTRVSGRIAGLAIGAALVALGPALAALAQSDDFNEAPIGYAKSQPTDPVAQLQARIERGQVTLARDRVRGYLPAVLKQLSVPVSSQMLVFSKTSFQRDLISPLTPRAIYFNDRTYVGYVPGGRVVEVSSQDPQLGAVFYTVSQDPAGKPAFTRQTDECLQCHASSLTKGLPGHVMRSVYAGRDGLPILAAGSFVTTDESPMLQRWGGWYVTGTCGRQRHMGNQTVSNAEEAESLDPDKGANVTDLRRFFDTAQYLSGHSDIVALMVIEHQTHVQNLITRANYETRRALQYEEALSKDLHRAPDLQSESVRSRIKSVCEPLVQALLFAKEEPLTDPVHGNPAFTAEFTKRGPRDKQGRSLRDFDLKTRLFRYPCSYLIYSEAFDALPSPAKQYVYTRLKEVVAGQDRSPDFSRLSGADRKAILEILTATKADFAARTSQ